MLFEGWAWAVPDLAARTAGARAITGVAAGRVAMTVRPQRSHISGYPYHAAIFFCGNICAADDRRGLQTRLQEIDADQMARYFRLMRREAIAIRQK
jgi:hypothetical protein